MRCSVPKLAFSNFANFSETMKKCVELITEEILGETFLKIIKYYFVSQPIVLLWIRETPMINTAKFKYKGYFINILKVFTVKIQQIQIVESLRILKMSILKRCLTCSQMIVKSSLTVKKTRPSIKS